MVRNYHLLTMKKIISLSFAVMFGFVFLCIPEDSSKAFYYSNSTTKKLPPYTLVNPDAFNRSQRYAITPDRSYSKVYLPYVPVQYEILKVGNESLVKVPLKSGVATYKPGQIRYWPSWIGVPPWWTN